MCERCDEFEEKLQAFFDSVAGSVVGSLEQALAGCAAGHSSRTAESIVQSHAALVGAAVFLSRLLDNLSPAAQGFSEWARALKRQAGVLDDEAPVHCC